MRKKLSTLVLLLLVAAGSVHAYDFSAVTSSGHTLYYNIVYSTHNVEVQSSNVSGALVIDSTVTYNNITYRVTSIGEGAFWDCTGLTSVTIPNSVTSIGRYAFCGCTGLTSVTIPNSVTSIGLEAFRDCTGLTSVTIPNSVTYIAFQAFSSCTGLTSVTIPNSVISIGHAAFRECTGLTSVTIPNSVTSIGPEAFRDCTGLTSVSLGEGVVIIGNEGFRNCYGINEITCLGRVAPSLGEFVFAGLDTSITVNIPCGTTNLYADCWPYFHNFNEIPFLFRVATDNPAQGTAQMVQEPSCDDPVAIVQATARSGYHFDHWSDGSTQNPYTCVVTGSMTLTAFFASDSGQTGIETADGEADGPNVYADGGKIVVTGAEDEEVCLYDMMGRLLATRQGEDIHFDVPAAGAYLVRIGNHPARRIVIVR